MATNPLPQNKVVSLINETENAIKLVETGTSVLAKWDGCRDDRIVALHLLAPGYERFLKLTFVLVKLSEHGVLPTPGEMKRTIGHGLLQLLDFIVEEVEAESDYSEKQAIVADLEFLRSNGHLRQIFEILGEFGSKSRYHDLNVLLDMQNDFEHPMRRWETLEMSLQDDMPDESLFTTSDRALRLREWYPRLAALQTGTIQRATRAIARIWTLGPAREEGRRMTAVLGQYLKLMDHDLDQPVNSLACHE